MSMQYAKGVSLQGLRIEMYPVKVAFEKYAERFSMPLVFTAGVEDNEGLHPFGYALSVDASCMDIQRQEDLRLFVSGYLMSFNRQDSANYKMVIQYGVFTVFYVPESLRGVL